MKASYTGPLFQIAKGASPYTTCDVVQDVTTHVALPAACIASVCVGGVASGCFWSIIYGQINATVNDLRQYNYGNSLVFAIDGTTGLPVFDTSPNDPALGGARYFITSNPGASDTTSDTLVTGAPTVGSDRSVLWVGRPTATYTECCGQFGWSHAASDYVLTVFGTDFMVATQYNTPTCASGHYCYTLDLEQGTGCSPSGIVTDLGTSVTDQLLIATFVSSSSTYAMYNNGHTAGTTTGATGCVPRNYARLASGGDVSATISYFREGALIGSAMSSGDRSAVTSNVTSFYSTLTFP